MNSDQPAPFVSLGSPSGRTFVRLRTSRRSIRNILVAVVTIALVATGGILGARKLLAKPAGSIGTTFALRPGPWGDVAAQPILIEAPASILSVNFRLGDGRWYFRAQRPDEVAAFLRGAGLTPQQTEQVLPKLQAVPDRGNLLAAQPPEDLIRALSPEVRSTLYDKLAAIPENFAQAEPFRTTPVHLDAWLDPELLPPALIEQIKGLVWRRGSGLFFSDYNIVADKITSPTLKLELLKQLTRKASVVLTLRIPQKGDVENLVRYYGFNGRREKVEPLLKALADAGGGTMDISNILPLFARARLYRFAGALPGKEVGPDCHWSSFNFFNGETTDESLLSTDGVEKVLRERYEPVNGEPRFGDIVLLTLPDGSSIHSAVYLADNIVFTKNGPSLATPFLVSTVEEMLAFYPSSERITLAYYRRKGA